VDLPWNPFVNGVLQAFHDARNLYLMLELIPCGTLRSLLQKRAPFNPATTAFYFANIVCGLSFLEFHGIIHRDIKPENILLGPDGYLCLADFGSAAREETEDDWLMVGTPTYMAPESFTPQGQSERLYSGIDWWSAGCVLYEMITRKMVRFSLCSQE
jgi:serine/threonine protein kinase